MYVLSFAGFFKFDDVSRIRRSDIPFEEDFMVIKVLKRMNLFSSPFLKGRALVSLLPLISQLVTLLLEGLFVGTCKVSELNRPSLVCIPYDLEEPLWKRIME